jgi:pantoate--beta-alanine ligase
MLIFKEKKGLEAYLKSLRTQGKTIGFIPTMGALHEGHLSLIKEASKHAGVTVCSIFVNPTQFNNQEDFDRYPIRLEEDIKMLLDSTTDILFLPSVEEMYGATIGNLETYSFGPLEKVWEGAYRPGHFQGVSQVMKRLLEIVHPEVLLMGQKDYQQTLIVRILINLLKINTQLITCPIIREPDGLAMSSRNLRLSKEAREKAAGIHRALIYVKDNFQKTPFNLLLKNGILLLENEGFRVEYLVVADSTGLQKLDSPVPSSMICLVAAWLDSIRLIDNVFL